MGHGMNIQYEQFPEGWERAMARATAEHLRAERINATTYAVRSVSKATCDKHLVHLSPAGRIIKCDQCPGWDHGGRERPCMHAGAVAKRLLREQHHNGHRVEVEPVIESRVPRGQFYRT